MVLPGLDGDPEPRRAFVARLEAWAPTRLVELPPEAGADYGALQARVAAGLPAARPFVLVAESFSGPIAARIAASAPAGLAGVVFVASFIVSPRPELGWLAPLLGAAAVGAAPGALVARMLLGRWATATSVAMVSSVMDRVPARVVAARLRAVLAVDATAAAARIAVPALALVASEDRLVPARSAARLLAANARARMEVIEGPHALLLAAPDAVADRVQGFVRAMPAR